MKTKKIISLLSAGTLFLASVSMGACGEKEVTLAPTHEVEPVYAYTFDQFSSDTMPIGAYIGPFGDYSYNGTYMESLVTDEQYATANECGLNFFAAMKQDYNVNREETMLSLDLAARNEMVLFIGDSYLYNLKRGEMREAVDVEAFKARVAAYENHQGFAGLIGRDEPFGFELAACGDVQDRFNEVFDIHSSTALYMNANGVQCPAGWFSGGPDYALGHDVVWTLEQYLEEYLKELSGAKFFSYDVYPFYGGTVRSGYLQNLKLVRDMTLEAEIPFWGFIQGGGYYDNDDAWDFPTEGGLMWNVSTTLAFGAKGYQYFPYCHPAEFTIAPSGASSLIGRYGEKTASWYYAQRANKQTKAIDHVLMNAAHMGVIAHGASPSVIPEGMLETYRELTKVAGDDALVGCFDYKGKTALYVVNNSVTKDKAKINLSFNGVYEYEVIQNAVSTTVQGDTVTLTFSPGEGALVVLK